MKPNLCIYTNVQVNYIQLNWPYCKKKNLKKKGQISVKFIISSFTLFIEVFCE